jgi:catechol 2,3-dioxygenase
MKGFLPDQTRISQVHLRTARLEELLQFYSGMLGLNASRGPGNHASFSAAPQQPGILQLTEDKAASPRPPRSTGLYHFALLYPTRKDLAQVYRGLIEADYPIIGASDHGVSEAIYLSDPEGNGIELYADRPRSEWQWKNGQVEMVTKSLDLDNLLATTSGSSPSGRSRQHAELGHIHLHVADLAAAERFYSEFLGFAVTQRSYTKALFFAAGGYHHHIGVNVWAGKASPPASSVGLISYRIGIPEAEILYCLNHRAPFFGYETRTVNGDDKRPSMLQIRDPNGSWLEVQVTSQNSAAAGNPGFQHQPSHVLCESPD